MDIQERNKRVAEQTQAMYRQPFAPRSTPEMQIPVEARVAIALEYIAAQLGTIARTSEKIESHLERIAASHPKLGK